MSFIIGALAGAALVYVIDHTWRVDGTGFGTMIDRVDPNGTIVFGGGGHQIGG